LKWYKSLAIDQIPEEIIQAGGKTLRYAYRILVGNPEGMRPL
jgi:hypothetical protein